MSQDNRPALLSTSSCYNRLPGIDIPAFAQREPGVAAAPPPPVCTARPRGQRLGTQLAAAALLTAALWPTAASAFCGFFVSGADAQLYNNASQVALLRNGNLFYDGFPPPPDLA